MVVFRTVVEFGGKLGSGIVISLGYGIAERLGIWDRPFGY